MLGCLSVCLPRHRDSVSVCGSSPRGSSPPPEWQTVSQSLDSDSDSDTDPNLGCRMQDAGGDWRSKSKLKNWRMIRRTVCVRVCV